MNKLNKLFVTGALALAMCIGLTSVSANTVKTKGGFFSKTDIVDNESMPFGIISVNAGENGIASIAGIDYDVNGDGKVNAQDLIDLRAYIIDINYKVENYDFDGDGKFTYTDMMVLQDGFAEFETDPQKPEAVNAKKKDFTPEEIARMDYNGDGVVDVVDVVLLRAIIAEPERIQFGNHSVNNGLFEDGTTKRGDANGDGTIDIVDVVMIRYYIVNGNSYAFKALMDLNGDGVIDSFDYGELRSWKKTVVVTVNGDLNKDGLVDVIDAVILRAILCREKAWEQQITITPNSGYRISKITINEKEVVVGEGDNLNKLMDSYAIKDNFELDGVKLSINEFNMHINDAGVLNISGLYTSTNDKTITIDYEEIDKKNDSTEETKEETDTTSESEVEVDNTAKTASIIMITSGIVAISAGTAMLVLYNKKKKEEEI